jgi:aldehyde dehydrogenase (NAD+)
MQEEIFGPVLPILRYSDLGEVISAVNGRPDPLTLYLFTDREATVQRFMTETRSGSVCVNDTLIHFSHAGLPFGGVGNSGMGRSHGLAGFLSFSHARSVIHQRFKSPLLQHIYPPYTPRTRRLIDWLLAYLR